MAVIPFTFTQNGDHAEVKWETIDGDDTGQWFPLDNWVKNTATVTGTFDSNTLTMQGSNDGTNAFTLTDQAAVATTFTAVGGKDLYNTPKYIRPSLGSGSNSDINVIVLLRK